MLEGHSCPRMLSFGDGVLGLGRRQQVQQYQGDDRIGAHLCTIRASVRSNRSGGPGRITPVGGNRVNLK